MGKKSLIIINFLLLIIAEVLWLIINVGFSLMITYKINLTTKILLNGFLNILKKPIDSFEQLFQNNSLYTVGSLVILLLFVYSMIKSGYKKNEEWKNSSKGTHGTANWGSFKELIKDGNYKYMPERSFFREWKKTGNWNDEENT